MAYNFNPKTVEEGVGELISKPKVATMYAFLWNFFEAEGKEDLGDFLVVDKDKVKFKVDYSLVAETLDLVDYKNNDLKSATIRREFLQEVISSANKRHSHVIDAVGAAVESLEIGAFDVGSGSRGLTATQQENIQVLSLAWWQACTKNNLPTTLPAYQAFIAKCTNPPKKEDPGFTKLINELADTTIFDVGVREGGKTVRIDVPIGTGQRYVLDVAATASKDKTWITASYYSAEKFHNSHSQLNYNSSGQYVFAHVESKGYGWFKSNYLAIMNNVMSTGTFPLSKKPDPNKWNPADMLAVNINSVRAKSNMAEAKAVRNDWKKEPTKCLNMYNKLIKDWFDSGNLIPISLKKSSANPKLKFMNYTTDKVDDKAFTHIMSVMEKVHAAKSNDKKVEILNDLISITQVRYDPGIQKCLVDFDIDIDGDGVRDTNEMYKFDIRGFEEGAKFSDILIQIMPAKKAMAGLGKISFNIADEIMQMYSGSSSHFTKLKRLRSQAVNSVARKYNIEGTPVAKFVFGKLNSIDRFMMFKGTSIEQAGTTLFGQIDSQMHGSVRFGREVLVRYVELLGGRGAKSLMREDLKFVKNKVQSYELGRFFDENKSTVNQLIRKKVLLSIYFYASSRGIFAFLDNKTINEIKEGYFRASPFVILGG